MGDFLNWITLLDNELFLYLNNLGSSKWDSLWVWISSKKTWIPLYGVLFFISCVYLKNLKSILVFVLCVAAMITFVDQTTSSFFKPLIGRLRPCHFEPFQNIMRQVKENCGGQYGFFSGHSSNSFALSMFFFLLFRSYKLIGTILLCWAALVAYSRIYLGVHFPLDILFGAGWGMLWGILFYQLWVVILKKWKVSIPKQFTYVSNKAKN